MSVNVKTYDGTEDPDDRLKIFQATAKIERWAMPTWCHMFNFTLIGSARVWFHKLPPESIDNYEMLRKTFLGNYSQQNKYIKGPVEIHHIEQREGESTEAFMERFKAESMHVNGAPECMRISGFMHEEVAAANQSKKKAPPAWKHHETGHEPNFDKRLDYKRQHKSSKWQDRFTPLTKTPKEILAMDTVKFKAPPPMTGPAKNGNKNKFCEFHGDKGHSTDECIHLRRQIKEVVKSGQLPRISFSTLGDNNGQETPIVIEAEVEGHLIHRMYVDGGLASEVLSSSPYNGIIGRPGLRKIQAVPSTAHGMLKFSVERGITTIRSSTIIPAECRMVTEAQGASQPREPTVAEGIKVAIHPEYPEQSVTIGESLSEKGRMERYNLLKENLDIFA
ncbi:reverse transcriptase domain-containing protein [Tanacetum coccineum]